MQTDTDAPAASVEEDLSDSTILRLLDAACDHTASSASWWSHADDPRKPDENEKPP